MSVTRRTFLRTALGVGAAALGSCALPGQTQSPAVLGQQRLTVWTTTYALDSAIARWRGDNPQTPLRRYVYEPQILSERLQSESLTGDGPDVVVADAGTIGQLHDGRLWRNYGSTGMERTHLAVTRGDCVDDQGITYAIPLAANPIGVWYDQAIFASALPAADPAALTAALGSDYATAMTQLGVMARTIPDVPMIGSIVDDILLPSLLAARSSATPYDVDTWVVRGAVARSTNVAAADFHYSGSWYQHLKHQRTAIVVGGRWMQQALARAVGTPTSSWRLAGLSSGAFAGPSLVAAVPALAAASVTGEAFARALADDVEYQGRIAEASQTVPSLRAAHTLPALVRSEQFCGGQAIGAQWITWAEALLARPTAASVRQHDHALRAQLRSV